MKRDLDLLSRAISDVGIWSWWSGEFPQYMQFEFSGVQIWNAPLKEGAPPSGQIALKFKNCAGVSFVSDNNSKFESDWPDLLAQDKLKGFTIKHGRFSFSPKVIESDVLSEVARYDRILGADFRSFDWKKSGAILGFIAGPVGLLVAAETMEIVSHSGRIDLSEIKDKNAKWWAYWADYWKAKEKRHPFPKDYACEVTIPAADE